jgi:YbgC/YbaW family acyl-CoA thioester hydrolase
MRQFTFPINVRPLDVNIHGIVSSLWYMSYFNESFTAFLEEVQTPNEALCAVGVDINILRCELDAMSSLRLGDRALARVTCETMGRTSFVIRCEIVKSDERVAVVRTWHTCVATGTSDETEIPSALHTALSAFVSNVSP